MPPIKKMKMKNILIIIVFMGLLLNMLSKYMSTERFHEIDIAHGDIQFYGRDSCPFCVKMKKHLEETPDVNSKIEHIDIETEEGQRRFQELNASGVPHFECKSTGKSTSGYQEIQDLLKNLGL
jgi:glutaredoxin